MKRRPCDSCLRRPGTRLLSVRGVKFFVCSGCAPTIPAQRRRVA